MYFSDLHVRIMSRGILNPDEQLVGQTVTSYMPWWAFGFIRRQYLVLATNQRLILVDYRFSVLQPFVQRLHQVDSIAWSNVQELKVKGLFLKKKLSVRGMGERGPISLAMPIPNGFFGLLAPMDNNLTHARTLASGFQQRQAPALPQAPVHAAPAPMPYAAAAPMPYAAPAPTPYAAPAPAPAPTPYAAPAPMSYAPPPQFAAPNLPSIPPQNAPGYASVPPPPPPGRYGVAPGPMMYAQPQGSVPPRSWS